jgi:hypothetical protein
MADKKISALDAATTPLTGTEVVAIVQSNTTKKVPVADLTTGRALSATQLTLTTGNLIVASGKGIDFSATSSGSGTMTSELLSDYEEGTWNAVISDGTNDATMTNTTCRYTRIGRQVFVNGRISTSSLGSVSGGLQIKGLPFATTAFSSAAFGYGANFLLVAGQTVGGYTASSGSIIFLSVWNAIGGISAMTSTQWTATGDLVIGFSYTV